jgi:hypothetical protein
MLEIETVAVDNVASHSNELEGGSSALPFAAEVEPPFTTDGRGRVVWSRTGTKNRVQSLASSEIASAS